MRFRSADSFRNQASRDINSTELEAAEAAESRPQVPALEPAFPLPEAEAAAEPEMMESALPEAEAEAEAAEPEARTAREPKTKPEGAEADQCETVRTDQCQRESRRYIRDE